MTYPAIIDERNVKEMLGTDQEDGDVGYSAMPSSSSCVCRRHRRRASRSQPAIIAPLNFRHAARIAVLRRSQPAPRASFTESQSHHLSLAQRRACKIAARSSPAIKAGIISQSKCLNVLSYLVSILLLSVYANQTKLESSSFPLRQSNLRSKPEVEA